MTVDRARASSWTCEDAVLGRDDEALRTLAGFEDGAAYAEPGFADWQYRRNPAGPARITLARDPANGALAGQFVMVPFRVRYRQEVHLAGLALNVLTHPAYRRRGVFAGLATSAFARCREEGLVFMLGFPNPPAYEGYIQRLGCADLGRLAVMLRPLAPERLLRRRLGIDVVADRLARLWLARVDTGAERAAAAGPDGMVVERLDRFPAAVNLLDRAAGARFPIMVVRDAGYLNWRFCDKPSVAYDCRAARVGGRLLAYAVGSLYREGGGLRGRIVDALSDGSAAGVAALGRLAREIVADQRRAGGELASVAVPPHAAEAEAFRQAGFQPYPRRLFPNGWVMIVRAHTGAIPPAELTHQKSWYLTFADADTT